MQTNIRFLLKIGAALQNLGMDAQRLESALEFLASKLGVKADFFSMPTSLMVAINQDDHQDHYFKRTAPGEIHLEKLSRINDIGNAVCASHMTPAEALLQIEDLERKPERYSNLKMNFFFGLSASAVTLFLGGDWVSALVAFLLGLIVGSLMVYQKQLRIHLIADAIVAFLVSFFAYLAGYFFPSVVPSIIILGSILVIIPGVTLTTAIMELASQHLAAGTSRFMLAVMIFLKMAFGIALGVKLFNLLGLDYEPKGLIAQNMLWRCAGLLLASLTLRVLFRAEPRDSIWMMLSVFVSFALYSIGQKYLGAHLGMMVASAGVTIGSNLFTKLVNRPILIPFLPAILVLVPGAIGFQSFNYLFQHDLMMGIDAAFTTITMVVSLVTGVFVGNLVLKTEQHF